MIVGERESGGLWVGGGERGIWERMGGRREVTWEGREEGSIMLVKGRGV